MLDDIDKGLTQGNISEAMHNKLKGKYESRLEQIKQTMASQVQEQRIKDQKRAAEEAKRRQAETKKIRNEQEVKDQLPKAIVKLLAEKKQTGEKLTSKEITSELPTHLGTLKMMDVIIRLLEFFEKGKIERLEIDGELRYVLSQD